MISKTAVRNSDRREIPNGFAPVILSIVLGKVDPCGVYDPVANVGWVSVGVDHDAAEFAVETLRRRWKKWGVSVIPPRRKCW